MTDSFDKTSRAIKALQLRNLLRRYPRRPILALYMCVNGFLTIGLLAALAVVTRTAFVFPSLGPTAILLFTSPELPSSRPRNVLLGHAIGILCGYFALIITGLRLSPAVVVAGVSPVRIIAAALSLALTGAIMVLIDVNHPPAGATTLIVSLGMMTSPASLAMIEIAVVLLVMQAVIINRLAGLRFTVNNPKRVE